MPEISCGILSARYVLLNVGKHLQFADSQGHIFYVNFI